MMREKDFNYGELQREGDRYEYGELQRDVGHRLGSMTRNVRVCLSSGGGLCGWDDGALICFGLR